MNQQVLNQSMQEVVKEMANGTQDNLDKTMNNIARGLFLKLQEKYPEAPTEDTIEFAKDLAIAHIRATAQTISR